MSNATTNPAQSEALPQSNALSSLLKAIGILKSVDEGALKDLEPLPTGSIESHSESHVMPTEREIDTGRGQSMRGFEASKEIAAHSTLMPQTGLAREYDEFNRRMLSTETAVKSLAQTVNSFVSQFNAAIKAEEEADMKRLESEYSAKNREDAAAKSREAKDAAMAAAIRKARIAVRKAMDEDEEDKDEAMEKADAALKALATLISKAEDEAEDDTDEERAEKARTELRSFKKSISKSKSPSGQTIPAPLNVTPLAIKSDNVIENEIAQLAAAKGMNVSDFMKALTGNSTTVSQPPAFAKAVQTSTGEAIAMRLEDAISSGELDVPMIAKAESIASRLTAARNGRYDMDAVVTEIATADIAVRNIFAPAVAA